MSDGGRDMLYCWSMSETDIDRLSRVMLDEFKRVHDRFDIVEERFDLVEGRLNRVEERLSHIVSELSQIHRRLDQLEEEAPNFSGYAKEIDHLLNRVTAIERHLGITHP